MNRIEASIFAGILLALPVQRAQCDEPSRAPEPIQRVMQELPDGTQLRVTSKGGRLEGSLAILGRDSIRLRNWESNETIALASIDRIETLFVVRQKEHVFLGTVIGFAVLFGARFAAGGDYDGDTGAAMKDFAVVGILGAAAGGVLGFNLSHKWRDVYVRPSGTSSFTIPGGKAGRGPVTADVSMEQVRIGLAPQYDGGLTIFASCTF